jgi:hypothetical protein
MLLSERALLCAVVRDLDTGGLTVPQLRSLLKLPPDYGT